MKSLYIVLVALVVGATSCGTKEGAPGPSGQNGLAQQGKVSGTLAYVDHSGQAVSIPFEYDYYETLSDNKFYYDEANTVYGLNAFRRDLKDYKNYVSFSNVVGGKANGQFTAPTSGYFEFSLLKVQGDDLFEFYGSFDASNTTSSYTITNFVFDPTTGRTIYDFVLTFDPSNINFEGKYDETTTATVTGRIDVILNRVAVPNPPVVAVDASLN
ncbi:hypothetical protein [Cytophaga aurantiaca]|uniref:hypothetical protein n=1 Tax=Cytophaga aurantiaca TaxID=29530 RepID=UPI00037EBDF1|nr:hypothetical protein [Cytophaga aurantiaca]